MACFMSTNLAGLFRILEMFRVLNLSTLALFVYAVRTTILQSGKLGFLSFCF